jgi:small subunit ribosomal protein S20
VSNTSRFRGAMRKFRTALQAGDKKAAQAAFGGTVSAIDKAAQKGTIHRNTAARYKSRLSARLAKLK